MDLSINKTFMITILGWVGFMVVGFVLEQKYDTILFYVFSICYFVSAMAIAIVKELNGGNRY